MNLLYKRPLATILFAFTAGSVFSFLLSDLAKLILCGLLLLLAILCFAKKHALLGMTAIALILSALLSYYTFSVRPSALSEFSEKEVSFTATVVDVSKNDYGITVIADIHTLDGEKPPFYTQNRITFLLTNKNASALEIGDGFTASARFHFLPKSELYALSSGCVAEPVDIVFYSYTPHTGFSLTRALKSYREQIATRIQSAVPTESGEFMTELLLGERCLSADIRLAFRRNGISHLLALSGMHLSILSLFVLWFLQRIRIPRTIRNLVVLLFVILYVGLTGFLPSVASAVMILFTPYVVTDVGFLLSVSATFGLLAAIEKTEPLNGVIKNRFLLSFLKSIIFTVSATLAAMPILAPVFGEISLLSIPANLIFSVPVNAEILFSLAVAVCPIAPVVFIAEKNGALIIWLARFTSAIPNTMLSLSSPEKYITVAVSAFLFFFLLSIPLHKKRYAYLPLCLMCLLVTGFQIKDTIRAYQNVTVSYAATYSSDAVCFSTKGSSVAIHTGSHAYALTAALDDAHKIGVTELSALILSDLDDGVTARLLRFSGNLRIHAVYLPSPESEDERNACKEAEAFAEKNRIAVRYYHNGDVTAIGSLSLAFGIADTEISHPISIALKAEDAKLVYLSSDYHKSGDYEMAGTVIGESDVVIVGNHRKSIVNYLPYRRFSNQLSFVVIGDKNLDYWQGIEAVNALKNAEVTITPALYRCEIKR